MNSHVFFASLLAGTIGMCAVTAGEQPRPYQLDDLKEANQPGEDLVTEMQSHRVRTSPLSFSRMFAGLSSAIDRALLRQPKGACIQF